MREGPLLAPCSTPLACPPARRPCLCPARTLQLLGAMAHCAPKQLGSCLPVVVPRLGEVLADPHPKVASAAKTALNEVSVLFVPDRIGWSLQAAWPVWERCWLARTPWRPPPPRARLSMFVRCGVWLLRRRRGWAECWQAVLQGSIRHPMCWSHRCDIFISCTPQVGSVIRNPEVGKLVPVLLAGTWIPRGQGQACGHLQPGYALAWHRKPPHPGAADAACRSVIHLRAPP